jgi:hypothetical protein
MLIKPILSIVDGAKVKRSIVRCQRRFLVQTTITIPLLLACVTD